MHPLVPILAAYALGLALLLARGGARDPLLSAALALPIGTSLAAVLVEGFVVTGLPLTPAVFAAAWGVLLALAVTAARRELRCLWPWPAAVGAGLAAAAIAAGRLDVAVIDVDGHDLLLAARVLSGGGDPAAAADLPTAIHAAFALAAPAQLAAFAPIFALAVALLVAVLVSRTVTHRSRLAIALAATLALATAFPLVALLLTVGSPAPAAVLLLAAAGLWITSERTGDRRPLLLAVPLLAAVALQSAPFAWAAGLFAAAYAGSRMRGRIPRVTRRDLLLLVVSWIAAAALIAMADAAALAASGAGRAQLLRLLPLALGNLLPVALVAALALAAADRLADGQPGRRLVVAAAGALLAAPYAVRLAIYTFSGPQAHAIAFRPLLVAAVAALVAASFAAALWLAARRPAPAVAAVAIACAAALSVASRAILPDEYGPLHRLLAVWALVLAALAGRGLAVAGRFERAAPHIAAAAALWAVLAGAVLARAHGDAWLVWSETGASRYLTQRWSFLTPAPDLAAAAGAMVVKPALESERTRALRAERAAAPAPDIVLFSIDGLRRDRVGAYGSRRGLTPSIDRFAARGVRFTRALSSFPTTQAFNSALLLGHYVDRSSRVQQPRGYRAEAVTNLLAGRDYHIFVKSWFDQRLKDSFDPALYRIDTYAPKATSGAHLEEPMADGLARVAAHLDEATRLGRPAFVWIHLLATHPMTGQGFVPHPDFDLGDSPMDRYESAVAGSDRWLAGLERLMAARTGRPTIWILFSDHGVNEDTRSRDLHEPLIRVPLVVVAPGAAPRVDDTLIDVSLDLAATVVDLAGIEPPASYDGVSLLPVLDQLRVTAMSARLVPLSYAGEWTGAVHGRYKVLRHGDVMSLFDLVDDPDERRNLVASDYQRALAMSAVAQQELARRFRAAAEARREAP